MANNKHKGKNSDDMVLKPDLSITFGNKASLKRSEETGIPLEDEKVIALMEGDTDSQNINQELAEAYFGTIARPDHNILFPDPASLKKRVVFIPAVARYAAAAVVLILISLGAWFTFNPASSPDRVQYTLASLDAKTVVLERIEVNLIQNENEKEESPMITAREEFELSAIQKKNPDPLQLQYALSISDEPSYYYLTSDQAPATSYQDYAQAEPKKRSFVGKIFTGMFNRAKAPFERNEAQAKPGPEKGFSIWNIAELGVKGINSLGDHEYTLVRDYNEKGNVKGVMIIDE